VLGQPHGAPESLLVRARLAPAMKYARRILIGLVAVWLGSCACMDVYLNPLLSGYRILIL